MEIGKKYKVIDAGDNWLQREDIDQLIGETVVVVEEETGFWSCYEWLVKTEDDEYYVRSKDLQPITAEGVEVVQAYRFNGRLYESQEKADAAQRRSIAKTLTARGYDLSHLKANADLIKAYLG